jgi:PII-like signaling protein
MKTAIVTYVRIYLTEGERQLDSLMKRLHDVEKVRGVTVFRGVSGFGKSGKVHSSKILDLSSDLPLVVEFFDEPRKVEKILSHLNGEFEAGHIVHWPAKVNI